MSELYDGKGNVLTWDGKNIFLTLRGRKEKRNIGWFVPDGTGGVFHTYRSSLTKFYALDGFAFNWHLFQNAIEKDKFKKVTVHYAEASYTALVKDVMASGKVIGYSKQGFELQIVYPLEKFIKEGDTSIGNATCTDDEERFGFS